MISCVEKRNQLRAEFDKLIEKEKIENLSSPELIKEALRLEFLLSRIQ